MIGRHVANIIKRFAHHRDDMQLGNFQRVRGLALYSKGMIYWSKLQFVTDQPKILLTSSAGLRQIGDASSLGWRQNPQGKAPFSLLAPVRK